MGRDDAPNLRVVSIRNCDDCEHYNYNYGWCDKHHFPPVVDDVNLYYICDDYK